MVDQKAYWVGFNLVKGIGAARLRALLSYFGDIETAWNAPVSELQAVGLGSKVIESLVQVRSQVSLQQVWDRIQREVSRF